MKVHFLHEAKEKQLAMEAYETIRREQRKYGAFSPFVDSLIEETDKLFEEQNLMNTFPNPFKANNMNQEAKEKFIKEIYPENWVKYYLFYNKEVKIGDFTKHFLWKTGLPIIKIKADGSECWRVLPISLNPLQTKWGIFYLIADISNSPYIGRQFLGILENTDEVYVVNPPHHNHNEAWISYLNKNILSYLYFTAKFEAFYRKYRGQYPIDRPTIRNDYEVLYEELVEEEADVISKSIDVLPEKNGFENSQHWIINYWDIHCYYNDWIERDEDWPPHHPTTFDHHIHNRTTATIFLFSL